MQVGIIMLLGLATILVAMFVKRSMNEQEEGFNCYIVRKGHVISTSAVRMCDRKLIFTAIFTDSCWYKTDSYVGNILYGISFGFDNTYNSVSIYWRPTFSKSNVKLIELYYCVSLRGVKKYQYLCSVELNEEVFIKVQEGSRENESELTLIYKGEHHKYDSLPRCEDSIPRFRVFPRFRGGKEAPHDIKIFISNSKF